MVFLRKLFIGVCVPSELVNYLRKEMTWEPGDRRKVEAASNVAAAHQGLERSCGFEEEAIVPGEMLPRRKTQPTPDFLNVYGTADPLRRDLRLSVRLEVNWKQR